MKVCPSLVLITVSVICSVPAYGNESREYKNKSSNINNITQHPRNNMKIRDWNIWPEETMKIDPPTDMFHCYSGNPKELSYSKQLELTRPNAKNLVAVIRVMKDGSVVLNPKGFGYGPIPPISEMTQKQAEDLWRSKISTSCSNEDIATYQLVDRKTKKQFLLDIAFDQAKVSKFRVRESDFPKKWFEVKKKEEDSSSSFKSN